jgi:inner membrane protein
LPTVVTHAFIPVVVSKTVTDKKMPLRFWILGIFCSVLADADTISFNLGIEYGAFFGHRGFFHSLFFAFILSTVVAILAFRKIGIFSKRWCLIWLFFFLITASHGVLDMFTDGGLGIALFSPFDTTRYFFPWRPLRVSPIGIGRLFSASANAALISEIIWIWLPLTAILVIIDRYKKVRKKTNSQPNTGNR